MKRVLVCEDNILTQKVLEVALKKINFEIVLAKDGSEGIQFLEEQDFDLVLTDINMPYNSGLEIVQYIRKHKQLNIPVIIVTNINLEDTRKHARELGADAYITKPFDPQELLEAIKSLGLSG